jgi:hypothetical protein
MILYNKVFKEKIYKKGIQKWAGLRGKKGISIFWVDCVWSSRQGKKSQINSAV